MELSVGVMLILLGVMNVRSFLRSMPVSRADAGSRLVHSHAHSHGDYVHSHPHGHSPEVHSHAAGRNPLSWLDRVLSGFRAYRPIRPLIVGIVHGLAGLAGGAFVVFGSHRDPRWAVAYLLVFGGGTNAGM